MSGTDVVLKKGKLDQLPSGQSPGALFFAQDDSYPKSGKLYLDMDNSDRVQVSGVGYNLGGQTVNGSVAKTGAEIFNDYANRTETSSGKQGNVALGKYSSAFGHGTTSEEEASFAIGTDTIARLKNTLATGYKTIASGEQSVTFGQETKARANNSIAFGYKSIAAGDNSLAGVEVNDEIILYILESLENNQYEISMSSSDSVINYLDSDNNLTDIGKLSIGSTITQSISGQGQAIGIVTDKKIINNKCIITIDTSSTFTVGNFKFMRGGAYGNNSVSFGKYCTVAGNNSISGGNSINVWGYNSIGWGSAENWNLEGDKVAIQNKINECDQRILNYQILLGQIEEPEDPEESDTEETDKTEEENKELTLAQRAYYSSLINLTQLEKASYELTLNRIDLYATYDGVGNHSAVFGLNNSSSADGSLIGGKYNRSYGNNSLITGQGNISHYPNMTILGQFSNSYQYSDEGTVNYDYVTKTGTSNHSKVENYSYPQLLIGNGEILMGSNSLEVFSNGLVRAAKSFRVEETGEIGILSETTGGTNYRGLKLAAFNTNLFLDSGHYICPPPSKSEKIELGAPSSIWKKIWTRGLDVSHQMSVSNSAFFKGYVFHNRGIQISSGKANGGTAEQNNEGVLFYDDSGTYTGASKFKTVVKIKTSSSNSVSRPAFSIYLNHANTANFKADFSLFYGPISKDRASLFPADGTTAPKIDLGETAHPWGVLYSGSVNTGRIDSNSIYPKAAASYALGSNDFRWNALYVRGINISEPGVSDGNGGTLVGGIYTNLLPNATGTRNLGSTTYRWKGIYSNTLNTSEDATVSGKMSSKTLHIETAANGGGVTSQFGPNKTNTYYLGTSSYQWLALHCQNYYKNGSSFSSDGRLKIIPDDFKSILEKSLQMYDSLNPICYIYKNILPEDSYKRTHIGFIAQEIENKIYENGLTNENCSLIQKLQLEDDSAYRSICTDGYKYYVNYNELHGLHTLKNHQQDARLAELEAKNKELENTISELKTQIELFKLAIGG